MGQLTASLMTNVWPECARFAGSSSCLNVRDLASKLRAKEQLLKALEQFLKALKHPLSHKQKGAPTLFPMCRSLGFLRLF